MADKRLNIILTVSDKGTVKVNKATKGIKNLEVQTVKSSRSMISSFVKVGAAVAAAFSAKILIGFTNKAISAADKIAKTAGKIGVGTDALQELQFAAERSGLSADAMSNNLEQLNRRLGEAVDGTGELKKITDQYGIAILDSAGKTRKAEDVLGDIAELIAETGDAAEKTRITYNAFGRSGVGMINALKGGREGLAALRKEARDTGNVIDAELLPGFEAARDAIDTAGGAIRTTFINAVGEAAPQIKLLADEIRKLAADEGFKDFVINTVKLTADLVAALATIPKAMAEIARALRGETSTLQQLQEAAVAEALSQGLFDDDKFVNLSLLNLEGQLRAITAAAPEIIGNAGLSILTQGRTALEAVGIEELLKIGPFQIDDTGAGDAAQPSGLGFGIGLEIQRLEQIQALREEAAAKNVATQEAMVASINAGEQEALDFSKAKAQERLDLVAELARQREEAQVEYVDSWRVAEQERTDAAIRASDIIAARQLEQTQATADAQADMLAEIQTKISQVGSAIGSSVAQVVVFGQNASDAFRGLMQNLASSIIQMLVQMTVQAVLTNKAVLVAAATAMAARNAFNISIAATASAAWGAALGGPIGAAASGAAGGVAASAAGVTALTTSLSLFEGLGAGIAVAHAGLTNVPREGTFLLDRGERVVAPQQNRDLTDFLAGAGGGGGGKRTEFVFLPGGLVALGKLLWDDSNDGRNRLAVT